MSELTSSQCKHLWTSQIHKRKVGTDSWYKIMYCILEEQVVSYEVSEVPEQWKRQELTPKQNG